MSKTTKRRRHSAKAGQAPGTLVYVGERDNGPAKVSVIHYGPKQIEETQIDDWDAQTPAVAEKCVAWINIDGLTDTALIEKIGKTFQLHPLVLEDVLNTTQRPKIEDYGEYIFVTVKMLRLSENAKEIFAEHVSLVLGKGFLITFQEAEGDVFDAIRTRIRKDSGRIRRAGADYLFYALLDSLLDGYYIVLEQFGEWSEHLEELLVTSAETALLRRIHALRRDAMFLRRSCWPMRELVASLERGQSPLLTKDTMPYVRNLYDHAVQVVDTVETFREGISNMQDLYLSSVSNRMNAVMKVLTIIATIFIPLTFLAGVYGMNFHYMPELDWKLGYPLVLLVMAIVAGAMLYYFRRKDWI